MSKLPSLAAGMAMLSLAIDPVLAEFAPSQERTLVAELCGGGEIQIQLGQPGDKREEHCPEGKACHAGACRKQFDPSQRPQRG